MGHGKEALSSEERLQVEEDLMSFPIMCALAALDESGQYQRLIETGIPAQEYPPFNSEEDKINAGVLGFLYAVGIVKKQEGVYFLDQNSIDANDLAGITHANSILRATQDDFHTQVKSLEIFLRSNPNLSSIAKRGLVLPLLRATESQKEMPDAKSEDITKAMSILDNLGLTKKDGTFNKLADTLLNHPVIGSFGRLAISYFNLLSNIYDASQYPEKRAFGEPYSRNQLLNADASNNLIANIITRLQEYMGNRYAKVADLGSGGGFFALGLDLPTILLDMSDIANKHAKANAAAKGKAGLLIDVIEGSITERQDLKKVAAHKPDAVTINYIIHDILGQASSYEAGLEDVRRFLREYGDLFKDTPLLITESWNVSWDHLRDGRKPYITLYTFLHAISPQQLISKEVFLELLEETGFEVGDTIVHGKMDIEGIETYINETLVVRRKSKNK